MPSRLLIHPSSSSSPPQSTPTSPPPSFCRVRCPDSVHTINFFPLWSLSALPSVYPPPPLTWFPYPHGTGTKQLISCNFTPPKQPAASVDGFPAIFFPRACNAGNLSLETSEKLLHYLVCSWVSAGHRLEVRMTSVREK